jgi:hypothetical protein
VAVVVVEPVVPDKTALFLSGMDQQELVGQPAHPAELAGLVLVLVALALEPQPLRQVEVESLAEAETEYQTLLPWGAQV